MTILEFQGVGLGVYKSKIITFQKKFFEVRKMEVSFPNVKYCFRTSKLEIIFFNWLHKTKIKTKNGFQSPKPPFENNHFLLI